MKRILFVVLLMSVFTVLSQSRDELPAHIKTSLYNRYPDATDISWIKNDSVFIIEFTLFDEQKKAVSDLSGKIIQVYTRITVKDIPKDVRQAVKENFSGAAILRAERLRTKNDKIHYIIFLEEDKSLYSVRFDNVGTIVNIRKVIPDRIVPD